MRVAVSCASWLGPSYFIFMEFSISTFQIFRSLGSSMSAGSQIETTLLNLRRLCQILDLYIDLYDLDQENL